MYWNWFFSIWFWIGSSVGYSWYGLWWWWFLIFFSDFLVEILLRYLCLICIGIWFGVVKYYGLYCEWVIYLGSILWWYFFGEVVNLCCGLGMGLFSLVSFVVICWLEGFFSVVEVWKLSDGYCVGLVVLVLERLFFFIWW